MRINNILKKLKNKLSPQEYDSYISLMEYDENASRTDLEVFYVPNIFVANWIKSNYLDSIATAFEEENSNAIRPEIHIKIKEKNSNVKSLKINKSVTYLQTNSLSLIPHYLFGNFIVGKSNEYAFTVAKVIADKQASAYNPVLFYGNSGLGKTHLLNAIGNYVKEQNKNVIYATAEAFLNEYTEKIKRGTMDGFRDKYRKCDYLLIDDVQFLGGKDGVQEELLNTFNALFNAQKQIVMTSDKPPKDIKGLADRLRSRFEGGMMTEITNPELETKISIIESKCELNRINLDKETINYIASNIHGNIRQIEGILSAINLNLNLSPESNTLKVVENVLKSYQNERLESITLNNIIKAVSKELNIKPSEIVSKERSRKVAFARRAVIYLARNLTINSMPMIAKELGMKDHSSVSKALKAIEAEIAQNSSTKSIIENIKSKIQQSLDNA
ncbi:chromosomal replication initiator protein DnaA [Helicobacter japonicus]|uniref:Chromosomal replication initiator protein DnaA n=2 Tax=Helicobacter japonicus TaxID=425400 RepID=A0A4U8TUW8_9HELI|nr:chromosomal replication initiator protein DnaA [Helicobacter japonicus]MDE7235701.1 chromosomal replication initiator protein DnaA [Helicobacter japonicus]TLE02858.1 chromosomal replication initiator protein DnaA [Helicobacter japonicus]